MSNQSNINATGASTRELRVAASAEQRLDAADAWLHRHARQDTRHVLVVSVSRGAADDLLRRTQGGFFGVHRSTLGQLSAELATDAMALQGLAPVSHLALEALCARAVGRCLPDLRYLKPVADLPGVPRVLARTLQELRAHGVDSDRLRALSSARGDDLGRLLDEVEALLDAGQLVDAVATSRLAVAAIEAGDCRYSGWDLLLLDVAPPTPLAGQLLAALAACCKRVLATAVDGDRESIERLSSALGVESMQVDPPPASRSDSMQRRLPRLRRHIFADPASAAQLSEDIREDICEDICEDLAEPTPSAAEDSSLVFLSAPGENRECAEIARRLLRAARAGIAFDRCAVALRDPETYLPLLEEAFYRARIPAYFTRGARRPDPAGRALLALLACRAERLSASRFAEYLSLGQMPPLEHGAPAELREVPWVAPLGDQLVFKSWIDAVDDLDDAPLDDSRMSSKEDVIPAEHRSIGTEGPPDGVSVGVSGVAGDRLRTPRHWERLLVDAAVIDGAERWRRRLDGVRQELRLQLRHLDDATESERQRVRHELDQLESLRRFALPLVDQLAELPDSATWGEWLPLVERLASRALGSAERVLEALAELRPMADVGPVTLDEVRRVLEERLSTLRTEPDPRRYGKVLVATIDELRGRSLDTLYLPGLAEGRFPRRLVEDPLLDDSERQRLDAGLPRLEQRVDRERRLLRLAVGAASDKLVLSYPNLDVLTGRARVPSFYALDLLRAAEGRLPDLRDLERRAAAAASSRLGWPAPIDPMDAMDDAEFDLATLADLMAQPANTTIGHGRFLLDLNPRLRRSLRNRYARCSSRGFSEADGLIDRQGALAAAFASQRLDQRSHSPTALQSFAACPYRFALKALVKLRPRDQVGRLEQLDPLTRGSLFHEIVFQLSTELRDRGLIPIDVERLALYSKLADQVLDQVAARYREELAPAIDRVWRSEMASLRLDIHGWLRSWADQTGWIPRHFELSFGLPTDRNHDLASTEADAILEGEGDGERRLRGSIDAVERMSTKATGGPDGAAWRVTDYKTGRYPHGRSQVLVGGGEILQPLLYAMAAENVLDVPVASGRLHYATRKGGYRVLDVALDDEGREAMGVVLDAVEGALDAGFLPAAPRADACRRCDFRLVCSPDEERRHLRKRDDERLQPLRHVRSLP